MQVAVFSTKPYDREYFDLANRQFGHELRFLESRLLPETVKLAQGFAAVCCFVNDVLDSTVLATLAAGGTRVVALRCAGFNNVNLAAARQHQLEVVRVPAYSPHAVAEFTVGLILSLNRKIHRAYTRTREANFYLGGLLGFDLVGRTVGIIGTGRIGCEVARIMNGFGCHVLAHDVQPSSQVLELGGKYVDLGQLYAESDIVTLHCPLVPATRHLINADAVARMKPGVMIINTSRGAVVDTQAVIAGLKSGRVGSLGLDVYEEEADYFFENVSDEVIADDVLARLLTFPNVLITGHQAFFTREAMTAIAETTLRNIREVETNGRCVNSLTA